MLVRILAALAALVFSGISYSQEPIRIGAFLAVTGPAAFLGDPEQKTLELYVEKLNAQGGVLGRKLQLFTYDSAGDAEKARGYVKRLIEQDKVDVIVGGTTTGETMAVVSVVEQAGVPFISLAGAVVITEPVKPWTFKTPQTDRLACQKIYADMTKRGLKRIALISGSGGFDKSMRAQCLASAKAGGVEIVADESYGAGDKDMTAQLTKIKNAAGVQAVLNAGFGEGPAIVTRNYRQLGITLPFYQSHGVASKEYIKLSGGAAEGVRLPAGALLVAEKLPADDVQKKVLVDYKRTYEGRFKSDVSTFGGHAWDGLYLAVEAIGKAGTTEKAKVRDALHSIRNFVGITGVFSLSPADHNGLDMSAFRMIEVRGGDWTEVK